MNSRFNFGKTRVIILPRHLVGEFGGMALGKDEFLTLICLSPSECFDLFLEGQEQEPITGEPETKAQAFEHQWAELELRLSFITDGCRWQ